MNNIKSGWASTVTVASFAVLTFLSPVASAQVTATGTGGAGGSGGSAAGGTATGGTASNTSNIGSATSNYQGGSDIAVTYVTPAGAAGVNGLAPGVDPSNNHVVSDNNVHYSGTTKIKNTPDVNLGGPASGVCNGLSGGIGVGIPGLAVGGNVSTVDKACEARETARIAAMLGRMDVANAILENMDVVVSALKAREQRDAAVAAVASQQKLAADAQRAVNLAVAERAAAQTRDQEAAAMRAQQQAGTEALARQATMAKVNDTLIFTGKQTQGDEKTPQQTMADELTAKQAAQAIPDPVASAPAAPIASPQPAALPPSIQPVSAPPVSASPAKRADAAPPAARTSDPKIASADRTDAIRFALNLGDASAPASLR